MIRRQPKAEILPPQSDADAASSDPLSYAEARVVARHADPSVRRQLAGRADIAPEILFYLAGDPDSSVRRQVALNSATPSHADVVLSRDVDETVRIDLARKIGRLAPDLTDHEQDNLQALTLEALQTLSEDALPRVRAIIAEEVKQLDTLPAVLIRRLARDLELIVAAPILEFSPLLSDDDLREIIESDPIRGALATISRRATVSEDIADSITATGDVEAITDLLANKGAQIREETLDQLLDTAPDHLQWHEPLVMRPHLSARALRRIARFVTAALLSNLEERYPEAREITEEVAKRVGERLDDPDVDEKSIAAAEVKQFEELGALGEASIVEWLGEDKIHHALFGLAALARIPPKSVTKIVKSASGKALTALSWRAGMSMRTAIEVQKILGRVPGHDLVYAKDGIDYPLDEEDMAWCLEIYLD